MGWNELTETLGEESSGSTSEDSDTDYAERPYVKLAPTVGIAFEEIVDVFWTGNLMGNDGSPVVDNKTTGEFGFVLKNPSVVKGEIYENTARIEDDLELARKTDDRSVSSLDYKVVDDTDWAFEESYDADGNVKGVKAGAADEYAGRQTDGFTEEEITVFVGGVAGREIARDLDVNGKPSAYIKPTGHRSNGMIEYEPDGEEPYWAVRRIPQLRDVDWTKGEESEDSSSSRSGEAAKHGGFIFLTRKSQLPQFDDDSRGYYGAIFHNDFDGDAIHEASPVERVEDHDATEYNSIVVWNDDSDEAEESTAEARRTSSTLDSESSNSKDTEHDATPDDSESSGSVSVDIGDERGDSDDGAELTDIQDEWVEGFREYMGDDERVVDVLKDFDSTVEDNFERNGGDLPDDTDPDVLRKEINRRQDEIEA